MKRFLMAVAAIACILTCSCTKHDSDGGLSPVSGNEPVFFATASEGSLTRTALDSSFNVIWSADDSISIFKGTDDNRLFFLKDGANTTSGTFKYCDWVDNGSHPLDPALNYAIYPCDKNATISGSVITTTLAAAQNYTDGSFENGAALMAAKSSTTSLTFKNVVGLIRFKFTKEAEPDDFRVMSVTMTSSEQNIAGEVTIDMSGDSFVASVSSQNAGKSITLDCGESGIPAAFLEQDVTNLYMVVPAGTFEAGSLEFSVKIKEGALVKTYKFNNQSATINVGRSKIVTIKHVFGADEFTGETEPYVLDATVGTIEAANTALKEMAQEVGNKSVTISSEILSSETNAVTIPKDFTKDNTPSTTITIGGDVSANSLTVKDENSSSNEYNGKVSINLDNSYSGTLNINLPNSTVTLNGVSVANVSSTTALNTLVVSASTTIGHLSVARGNVDNYGTIGSVERDSSNSDDSTFVYMIGVNQTVPTFSDPKIALKYPVAEVNQVKYADFSAAVAAVNSLGSGSWSLNLLGDVQWYTGTANTTSTTMFSVSGATVNFNLGDHSITFTGEGGFKNAASVNVSNGTFIDNTEYTAEGANPWEHTYLEIQGAAYDFNDVTFHNTVMFQSKGGDVNVEGCVFEDVATDSGNAENEYAAWIAWGTVSFKDCVFKDIYRGIKITSDIPDEGVSVASVTVDGCRFENISKKPGLVIDCHNTVQTTVVTIKNSNFDNCKAGDQNHYIYELDNGDTPTIVNCTVDGQPYQ